MNEMQTTLPVVNARYIPNRSKKTGKIAIKRTLESVKYIGYGHKFENPKQFQRGQWYSQDGEQEHDEVTGWAADEASQHKYTYTFVLSIRDAAMQDEDFVETVTQMMTQQKETDFPTDWRMMVHRDSDHDHAHLVMFRDKTLRKAQLAQWRQAIQHELAIREEQRLEEQAEQGITRQREYLGGLYMG